MCWIGVGGKWVLDWSRRQVCAGLESKADGVEGSAPQAVAERLAFAIVPSIQSSQVRPSYLAVGETVILLHPPLPLVGESIVM